MLLKRKQKPKKLNLRQIHSLYLLLKPFLPPKEEKYLIDEVEKIVDRMNDAIFLESLRIMYSKPVKGNPVELLFYFIRGMKQNTFFEYVEFIQGLGKYG